MSKQKLIDVIQWILIIGLSIVLLIGFIRQNEAFTKNAEYEKNNTYVKIYESQNISKLKKENKALYDSIKKLKNVESAIEIRYKATPTILRKLFFALLFESLCCSEG